MVIDPNGMRMRCSWDRDLIGSATDAAVCISCVAIVLRAAKTVPTSVRVKPQVVK
jgi:hypothetical protein